MKDRITFDRAFSPQPCESDPASIASLQMYGPSCASPSFSGNWRRATNRIAVTVLSCVRLIVATNGARDAVSSARDYARTGLWTLGVRTVIIHLMVW